MKKTKIAIIPARMASSRFPGKPLTKILDLPMIEHIRRRALLANGVDDVIVATCDKIIMDVVTEFGGKAIMTSDKHERSSERIAEAMNSLEGDIVVVAQGDEPLLMPENLRQVTEPLFENNHLSSVSLLSSIENASDFADINIVKAVCDQAGYILFYSRAPIPYMMQSGNCPVYRETGIRAFRASFLQTYVNLPETPFECVESVDMLRLLEHGYKVFSVLSDQSSIGVDHKEDVIKVEHILKTDPIQKALYQKIIEDH